MLENEQSATPPVADSSFLEEIIDRIMATSTGNGEYHPTAFIASTIGPMRVVTTEGFANEDDKSSFMNVLRYLSIRHASQRMALVYGSWVVESDDEKVMRQVKRLMDSGRSISTHPAAKEIISVCIESDAGRTFQRLDILRFPGMPARIVPAARPLYIGRDNYEWQAAGVMSDFHVTSIDRLSPAVQSWARYMDGVAGHMVHPLH